MRVTLVRFLIAALALPALIAIPVVFAPEASAAGSLQSISVYGGNGTVGTVDTATEVSTNGGATWGQAYFAGVHPWGLVAGTSTWVNCGPSLNNCLNAVSWYRYRFYLASDFETTTLTAAIKVDNYGSIYINGSHLLVGGVNLNVQGGSGGTWSGSPPDWSTTDMPIQSYLHAGWNDISIELTDVGGLAGINYAFTIKTYSNSPISLSTPGQVFTVTYDAQGGSVGRSSDTATAGNAINSFPTPTKANATFDGWFTAASGGTQITAPYSPSANQTLYAHWTNTYVPPPIVYSTIFFNPQGGVTPTTANTLVQGSSVTAFPQATRSGYNFLGWFTDPIAGNQVTAPYSLFNNTFLHAHWQRIIHTVRYTTGDSATVSNDFIADGESLTSLPIVARSGYTFLGWRESQSATSNIGLPQIITSDRDYYAHWQANTYQVTINTPSGVTTLPVTQGESFTAPSTPQPRAGYTFLAWNTAPDGSGANYAPSETISQISVSQDFALYPIWLLQNRYQPGAITAEVFFGLDEYLLKQSQMKVLADIVKKVKLHQLPSTLVNVKITGWVQPTTINPAIDWLSHSRALAVKRALVKLGLKAVYTVEAPGLSDDATASGRKSSIEVSWSIK